MEMKSGQIKGKYKLVGSMVELKGTSKLANIEKREWNDYQFAPLQHAI